MPRDRFKIDQSTFIIASNGFADGPASALRDYLIKENAAHVVTIDHPLVPEGGNAHVVTEYSSGNVETRVYRRPHRPPFTYLVDPFTPVALPRSTAWFGFNNLATLRGLIRRSRGRVDQVVHWAVDFVPDRFGAKNLVTSVYNTVDRIACRKADWRVELSPVGVSSRNRYLGLPEDETAPTQVVPMGAWLDRTPKVPRDAWKKRKLVYLGHLVPRQGVATLISAVRLLLEDGQEVHVDIVGSGPMADQLCRQAKDLDVADKIDFHGFVEEHREVEAILASGTLGIAPYRPGENFVRFGDSGKLKAYLGAGLPIVLTDVPNNAADLARAGAAFVAGNSPEALARTIKSVLINEEKWLRARTSVDEVAREFDWNIILRRALGNIGFEA